MWRALLIRPLKAIPKLLRILCILLFLHLINQNLPFLKSSKQIKPAKFLTPRPTRSTSTTRGTTPRPPPPIAELQAVQEHRVNLLRQECQRLETERAKDVSDVKNYMIKHNFPTRPFWPKLYCVEEEKISYCPNFKSATTFIFKKLLQLAPSGKYDKDSVVKLNGQANELARKEFKYLKKWESYQQFTEEGTTFMFVRHPFERLLSAFRDKLEDPEITGRDHNEYYYNKYGRRIVKIYREESNSITGPDEKYPSSPISRTWCGYLEDFKKLADAGFLDSTEPCLIRLLAIYYKFNKLMLNKDDNIHKSEALKQFSEFIRFILDKDYRYDDEHWIPYFMACSPCHIPFNFIGHYETMYWDIVLLADKTGLTQKWVDPHDYHQTSTNSEVVRSYYNQLDNETIIRLYKRYEIDFNMFGYTIDDYISVNQQSEDSNQNQENNNTGDTTGNDE